jgi:hypothetical protein
VAVLDPPSGSAAQNLARPEDYGAVGDGVADDSAAIKAAIATGRTVVLDRPKTYLIAQEIGGFAPGQVLEGSGATLKRARQVQTTTDTPVTSGGTVHITVANPAGLDVGASIVLDAGGGNYDKKARPIASVDGNTITVSSPFGITASGTIQVYTAGAMLMPRERCRIRNVRFDGNRSNWSWAKWWHNSAISCANSDDVAVEGCVFVDLPGEGVVVNDSHSARVLSNTFRSVNGNAVHYGGVSGCRGGRVIGNRFLDTNLKAADVEHSEGVVCVSAFVSDLLVHGNHMANGLVAVGSIDSSDNLDITISGNEIRNMRSQAIEGVMNQNSPSVNVSILGNRFYDNQQMKLNGGSTATQFPQRWKIEGNTFVDTALYVGNSETVSIQSNSFASTDNATLLHVQLCRAVVVAGNVLDNGTMIVQSSKSVGVHGNVFAKSAVAPVTLTLLKLIDCQGVVAAGNTLDGGGWGIRVDTATTRDVRVARNVLRNQGFYGVYVVTAGLQNVVVEGNTVTNDDTADANYVGVRVLGPARVRANDVSLAKGAQCVFVSSGAKSIVKDNTVRGARQSIKAEGSTSGTLIKDNEVDLPIADLGSSTTSSGNVVTG